MKKLGELLEKALDKQDLALMDEADGPVLLLENSIGDFAFPMKQQQQDGDGRVLLSLVQLQPALPGQLESFWESVYYVDYY
jgi:hypothetical protein